MSDNGSTVSGGRMEGRVVIVTGGARGMGAAHSELLVAEGAQVVLSDLREDQGEKLAEKLGTNARFHRADVSSPEDWDRTVAFTEEVFGAPTGLINNAGILELGSIEDTTPEQFRRSTDIMMFGVFLGMRAVIPAMKRSGGGTIVNISSTAGLTAYPEIIGYVAAKWAVRGMTKAAAVELGEYGIRVNSIHPGEVETDMILGQEGTDAVADVDAIPLHRFAQAPEIARLALFLMSDESGYVTGAEHIIDGGATALA
ncbi:MAG: glucose 1-dehydrogenase [Actinobacteria bacterium]|nr:glucose 1-dehydrogenase [Actinomycetota bacterium]